MFLNANVLGKTARLTLINIGIRQKFKNNSQSQNI